MATRQISECRGTMEYVAKRIPFTDNLKNIQFSNPIVYFENWESLDSVLEQCTRQEIASITQQYNEIYLWHMHPHSDILAPQVMIQFESNGLPIIYYPRFVPMIDETEVWIHSIDELNILLGMRAHALDLDKEDILNFLSRVSDFCEEHNLCSDDIFLNPSNIGWHTLFGLRIIDYGLTKDNLLFC